MAILIVAPVASTFVRTFAERGVVAPVMDAFTSEGIGRTLLNTAIVASVALVVSTLVGSILAWVSERTDARIGWVSGVMPALPLLIPPVALAIGFVFLFSPRAGVLNVWLRSITGSDAESGPVNIFSWYGLIAVYIIEMIPITFLIVSAALRNADPALEQASRAAGAGLARTFLSVTLPSVKSALAASTYICFTMGIAIYSAPMIIGSTAGIDVLSVRIVQSLTSTYPPQTDVAIVLSCVLLLCIAAGWILQTRVIRNGRFATIGGKGKRTDTVKLGRWVRPVQGLTLLFFGTAVLLPAAGLVLVSVQPFWSATIDTGNWTLDSYRDVFAEGTASRDAIVNSVQLGVIGATIAIAIALAIALAIRERSSIVARLVDGIAKLPAGLSHIVIAIGVLVTFAGAPFQLSGTIAILLIAYVIIYMPQASIIVASATASVGRELTEASSVSGSGQWGTVRRVMLPLTLPMLATGWMMIFVYIAGELTASIMLAGTSTPTVGYLLLNSFGSGTYPGIAALALILTAVSATVVMIVMRLTRARGGWALSES